MNFVSFVELSVNEIGQNPLLASNLEKNLDLPSQLAWDTVLFYISIGNNQHRSIPVITIGPHQSVGSPTGSVTSISISSSFFKSEIGTCQGTNMEKMEFGFRLILFEVPIQSRPWKSVE